MAKKKVSLKFGAVFTFVAPDEQCACILEVLCADSQALHSDWLRQFVQSAGQLVVNKKIAYLNRNEVPWEDVREKERSIRAEAEAEFATSDRVADYIRLKMGQWYQEHCLLEQNYEKEEKMSYGLKMSVLAKENAQPFVISSLKVLTVSCE